MTERREQMFRRGLGSPMLFSIVYTVIASAIYFALGVVAGYALGLTPLVFVASAVMFVLAAMTYVEGSSLHQDRGGSTVFARYAFNELWSFVAGWAVLLDYVILIAATAFCATNYLAAFWSPLGEGVVEAVAVLAILAYVAVRNVRGFSSARSSRIRILVVADIALQLALIAFGMALLFHPHAITSTIHLGTTPTVENLIVAFGIATVVSTGLESASGLSGEVAVSRGGLKRLVSASSLTVFIIYTGIAIVAISAQPVIDGTTKLSTTYRDAPMLGIAAGFQDVWLRDGAKYLIAAVAAVTLIAASNSAMLGLSRLAYSLSTNRQIPSALGRLHPTRFTPWVLIVLATVVAAALAIPEDLDLLLGAYAFGALLGLTIAHAAIIRMRFTEPDAPRPYDIPFDVRIRGTSLPLPAVLGVVLSFAAWVSVLITHSEARWVGLGWMAFGLVLYVVYRRTTEKPLLRRVTVPREALLGEHVEAEYGSILVPIFGRPLDDDIMQTAGRLAAEEDVDEPGAGATIEAIWVFEVPMSLPIDARLPDAELQRARAALARAKAVGEEYEGVEVATATVRARRAGEAIVEEARRRGVQAIVLAAEEPSKIRGGTRLGGRAGMDAFVGEATKLVVSKAPCPVILTAPPVGDRGVSEPMLEVPVPPADAAAPTAGDAV
ncbi:MAG TPA: amino acid permease [Solirubrobacteraceae bacterium]|nr:amino acid permease [Solirubrobacteraceae bacterium]